MKKFIRIVNEESTSENINNYYCEFSLDNGKKWTCESMLECYEIAENPNKQFLHEDVLWWIEKMMYNGFQFVGVKSSKDILNWQPWL